MPYGSFFLVDFRLFVVCFSFGTGNVYNKYNNDNYILMTMIKDKMRNNDQMVPVKCSNKLDIRILKPGVNRYLALSSKKKWLLKWSIFLCCRQYVKLHGNILYIAKLVNVICCKMDLVNVIYILATYKSY